ncbi:MAG TPA: 30S ribosomal protein S17e [Candidatus Acidoferrales bacterium]|nr:30S ribosomal protein S17e [Candidatus Acidoferrales bacterium]
MGKVKTDQVKRTGKELMHRFPEKFNTSFDENKHAVETLTQGTTTRVRNQIAGYITRTLALAEANSGTEPIEADEEDDSD